MGKEYDPKDVIVTVNGVPLAGFYTEPPRVWTRDNVKRLVTQADPLGQVTFSGVGWEGPTVFVEPNKMTEVARALESGRPTGVSPAVLLPRPEFL